MCPPLASSSFCFLLPPPILILFSSLSSSLFLFCFNSLSTCLIFFWFIYNFFFTICPWGATSLGFVLLCKLAFLIVAISTCNHHLERYTLSFFNQDLIFYLIYFCVFNKIKKKKNLHEKDWIFCYLKKTLMKCGLLFSFF